MACNIRGEIGQAAPEGCTAYVIGRGRTAEHGVIAGQNSDMTSEVPPLAYVLHLKPKDKPEVLIWTFGGMIGYHGMNSAGIAHFANALGGGRGAGSRMPHYPVKRLMLECSRGEVVICCQRFQLASNGNYVLCDGHGKILDMEATTTGPEVIQTTARASSRIPITSFARGTRARRISVRAGRIHFPRIERSN